MVAAHGRPRAAGRVRAPGRRGGGASQQAAAAGRAASGHAHQSGLVEEGDRLIIVPTRRQSRRQTQWARGGMSRNPPKVLLSPARRTRTTVPEAIGTLTVAQHKQRISAASLKVSSAPLPCGRSSSACTTHPTF